jgi:hypothetical protein
MYRNLFIPEKHFNWEIIAVFAHPLTSQRTQISSPNQNVTGAFSLEGIHPKA